jgi:hypothetical protein
MSSKHVVNPDSTSPKVTRDSSSTMAFVLEMVVDWMRYYGKINKINGREKKLCVLQRIRSTVKLSDEIEDMIIATIDMIIKVDNGKIKINQKLVQCCVII